jgi:glycopeptide antibiotics resistance protein
LSIGLPLGVLLVAAIFINFFSRWNKRADKVIQDDPSNIIVILVAIILIVVFIVIFSARHRWDMNEQRYLELVSRKDEI